MLNSKFLLLAATLVAMSGCGKHFDGRYEGVEVQASGSYSTYPSTAVMNLKQDGDLVTGDYTVQRMQQMAGQTGGGVTYRITGRAKSDTLEGVQLTIAQNANSQYGQWGYWGGSGGCTYLGGNLNSTGDGKQISGTIGQGGAQQQNQYNTMCSFNLNLTKTSD